MKRSLAPVMAVRNAGSLQKIMEENWNIPLGALCFGNTV